MTILFMYDSPLRPEAGGTERSTKLVMDEMERRGHTCIGLLHFNQDNPDEYFLNGDRIKSLTDFLDENHVDVVVNHIAFHYWLLKEFLIHGGQEWKEKGGKIVSFMHFDPTYRPKKIKDYYRDFYDLNLYHKIKRLGFALYFPLLQNKIKKEGEYSLKYIYDKSDIYVVMSKSYINILKKRLKCMNLDKVRVVTNMLTFPEIADESIITNKDKIVLVVSRLDEEQKRISKIIKAWKSIRDYNGYYLHIVGTGLDELYLKNLARGCNNLVFEGHQSPLLWYQRARIFMLASPAEGWGLTLTESLQNGVVPIAMNTSRVFADIIDDGVTGYLANSEKEYSKRLQQLISDDYLRNDMAKKGLKSAKRFSSKAVGDKWEAMLNE